MSRADNSEQTPFDLRRSEPKATPAGRWCRTARFEPAETDGGGIATGRHKRAREVGYLSVPLRRAESARDIRLKAEGPGENPRSVPADFLADTGIAHLRASAPHGRSFR